MLELKCPHCSVDILAILGNCLVREGEILICAECCTTVIYGSDHPGYLRQLTQCEWDLLRMYQPAVYEMIQQTINFVYEMMEDKA